MTPTDPTQGLINLLHSGPNGRSIVGMAVIWPVPVAVTHLAYALFIGWTKMALKPVCDKASEFSGMWGPGFMLTVAEVRDRNAALGILRRISEQTPTSKFFVIAFFDADEGIWRNVHPSTGHEFELLLTPENIEACGAFMRAQLAAALEFLGGAPGKGENE